MKNFLDEHPQDWTNPEYLELQKLLVFLAKDSGGSNFLKNLADLAGIEAGLFPERGNLDSTSNALVKEMGKEGRLRKLVEAAANQNTVHQQRLSEMLTLPARKRLIFAKQILSDDLLILDRVPLREKLERLESDSSLKKVLVVRGDAKSGKSHGRFLFEQVADQNGAVCVYLCESIVGNVEEVIEKLFSAIGAAKEIPAIKTTPDAWYKTVCNKLQDVAVRKKRQLWIAVDDLGTDADGVPLLDEEIRKFCEQFTLQMIDPAFRKWFRLMLIHYPSGPVPTKWKKEYWEEEQTNAGDIQENHILEFLEMWRASQNRTILEDQSKNLAKSVMSKANESTEANGNPENGEPSGNDGHTNMAIPRLQIIHDQLTQALRELGG